MRNIKFISLMMVLLSASACSMKDRIEVHNVSVELPREWKGGSPSSMSILNHASSYMSTAPTGITGFQCYALNVIGSGIAPSDASCADPTMGQISNLVPVSTGQIGMDVLAGPARTVQLIGVQSTLGYCPAISEILLAGGRLSGLGDPYVLGSTTLDIVNDTAVTILASYIQNVTPVAFPACSKKYNGGPELRLNVVSNSPALQVNNCSKVGVFVSGATSAPPNILPIVTAQPTGGTAQFFKDLASCTAGTPALTAAVAFPPPGMNGTNYYLDFYVKASGTGSFTAQANAAIAGWGTPSVTYNLVSDRLTAALPSQSPNPSPILINSCVAVNLGSTASKMATSPVTVNLEVHNNNVNIIAPAMKVYANSSDCSAAPPVNALVPTSSSYGSSYYALPSTLTSGSAATIYVTNSAAENNWIGVTRSDNGAEPIGVGINFQAFDIAPPSGLLTLSPTVGGSFSLTFNAPQYASGVTTVKLAGAPCTTTFSGTMQNIVTCAVNSVVAEGTVQAISILKNGVDYPTPYTVTYGTPPAFQNPGDPFPATSTGCSSMGFCQHYGLADYHLMMGNVSMTPPMINGSGITCELASGTLPAGFTLNAATCGITGTISTTPGNVAHAISLKVTKVPYGTISTSFQLTY